MNILGRPYVFGDQQQTEYLHKQFRKEDLQDKIINGINQALEGIDEYVYEFNSTNLELQKTICSAVARLLYVSGVEYDEDLEIEWNSTGNLEIEWVE